MKRRPFYFLLILFSYLSADIIAQDCYEKVNSKLEVSEVILAKHPIAESQKDFVKYFCPSEKELSYAKELLIENFNQVFLSVPGGKENFRPIKNVRKYLEDWKSQYVGYLDINNERNVYMFLIKNISENQRALEIWRKESVLIFDHSSEQLSLNFVINICSKTVKS